MVLPKSHWRQWPQTGLSLKDFGKPSMQSRQKESAPMQFLCSLTVSKQSSWQQRHRVVFGPLFFALYSARAKVISAKRAGITTVVLHLSQTHFPLSWGHPREEFPHPGASSLQLPQINVRSWLNFECWEGQRTISKKRTTTIAPLKPWWGVVKDFFSWKIQRTRILMKSCEAYGRKTLKNMNQPIHILNMNHPSNFQYTKIWIKIWIPSRIFPTRI